ncbi:hypothetical protein A2Z22_01660 [Candidatus Woesebacteria bacterium RBG_16_34_12]|uniref:ABC transporter ATP-binding protein n=1 Tax=Candidatus Woesebacteria bacterium RBG_16_34_12 TaxID=1802480 RepID=A0A1F7XA69_9BACT|nr:MAG: hypothetical protein A2Z22_01660 [Candidatus Woesebacteria bacterium RBG_16_34_12]
MLKILRTFYYFVLKKKLTASLFLVVIILSPLAEAILPYFYKLFVDSISELNYSKLFNLLVIYIVIYFLGRMLNSLAYFIGDILTFDAGIDARSTVFKHIHSLDFAYHTTKSSGSLISAIKRGDSAFWDLHHSIHYRIVGVIVSFIVMMCFFINLDLRIFLLAGLSFVLALGVTKIFVNVNISTRNRFNKQEDRISSVIVDNMVNFETVKLFAKERWEEIRLKKKFKKWKKALWDYSISFRLLDIGMALVMVASIFAMLYLSIILTKKGEFSAGDFVLVIGFSSSFYPKLFDLVWGLRQIAKNYSDIERYFGILELEIQVKDPKDPMKLKNILGEIEYKNVTFSYEKKEKDAIRNINLKIRPGQSVAFVGRSGAGKTTIVKLLLRFFDIQKGEINIDGINIKSLTKSDLRSLIGVVPQEPVLFNNTIGYNIAYGKENVGFKEIVAASKLANIHDFINSLPKKYNTQVGERGIKLSGGQKQRVAIARMILSDPDIVIFDEATSQLDSESEKLIQEAFWKAVHNKTTIIIAHRLSTVMRADKIVVMEKGRIVETGSHNELIREKQGLYKHFWELQTLE